MHDRYLDLTALERDSRTLKTGLLEIRPVSLRKADRTRGHALVSLLALKLARALERRVAPLGLTVVDAVERLKGVRLVRLRVLLAECAPWPSVGAEDSLRLNRPALCTGGALAVHKTLPRRSC